MAGDKEETLLCIIPFPEPKAITASIKKKFPKLKIIYVESELSENWRAEEALQPGKDALKILGNIPILIS